MLVLGLTGGIATGKSTVAEILRELGAIVFSADLIAHETIAPDGPAYEVVLQAFGPEIRAPDGTIDRGKLGERVFRDPQARLRLESIIHPIVIERLLHEVKQLREDPGKREAVVVLEVPLLFEAKLEWMADKILLVAAEQDIQIRRLTRIRGLSVEEAERRIAAQMPITEKKARADWIIENGGSPEETRRQVEALWPVWCQMAAYGV